MLGNAGAEQAREYHILVEGRRASCGLIFLDVAGILESASWLVPNEYYSIAGNVLYLAFGILAVIGILLIASADLDLNQYLRHNQWFLIAFSVVFAAARIPLPGSKELYSREHRSLSWLTVLPFVVLLLRYTPVVDMKPGFPRFTELLMASFVLELLHFALEFGMGAIHPKLEGESSMAGGFVAAFWMLGTLLTSGVWYFCGNGASTATFKIVSYSYLFSIGLANLVSYFVVPVNNMPGNALYGTFVAIHVLPPVLMLICRDRLLRLLGRSWLRRRQDGRSGSVYELSCVPGSRRRGDLIEVEGAVIGGADLNAIVLVNEGGGDEYTLLHLAVLNNHLDALQRLLHTGAVEINKPTPRRGRSALFLAAAEGRIHAATMLLECAADVNALSDERQSPLIVAAANGRTEMVKLLQEHGAAQDFKWMRLRAEDIEQRQTSSVHSSPLLQEQAGHAENSFSSRGTDRTGTVSSQATDWTTSNRSEWTASNRSTDPSLGESQSLSKSTGRDSQRTASSSRCSASHRNSSAAKSTASIMRDSRLATFSTGIGGLSSTGPVDTIESTGPNTDTIESTGPVDTIESTGPNADTIESTGPVDVDVHTDVDTIESTGPVDMTDSTGPIDTESTDSIVEVKGDARQMIAGRSRARGSTGGGSFREAASSSSSRSTGGSLRESL